MLWSFALQLKYNSGNNKILDLINIKKLFFLAKLVLLC